MYLEGCPGARVQMRGRMFPQILGHINCFAPRCQVGAPRSSGRQLLIGLEAPENYIRESASFSTEADCFSFGCIMLTLGRAPWPDLPSVFVPSGKVNQFMLDYHVCLLDLLGPVPRESHHRTSPDWEAFAAHDPQHHSRMLPPPGALSTLATKLPEITHTMFGVEGVRLLSGLLQWDPATRTTASAAANHAYCMPCALPLGGSLLKATWCTHEMQDDTHAVLGPPTSEMQGVGDQPELQEVDPKRRRWNGCRHQWNIVKGTMEPAVLHDMQKEAEQVIDGMAIDDLTLPHEAKIKFTKGAYVDKSLGIKIEKRQDTGHAAKRTLAAAVGTGRGKMKAVCRSTAMCGLKLQKRIPMPTVNAWLEAFLHVNRAAFKKAHTAVKKTLSWKNAPSRRGRSTTGAGNLTANPNYRSFQACDSHSWFLRCGELHVARPSEFTGKKGKTKQAWLHEPRHNDGLGSVMHMSLTIYGRRDVHFEQVPADSVGLGPPRMNGFPSRGAVDLAKVPDDVVVQAAPGTVYLGQVSNLSSVCLPPFWSIVFQVAACF